MFNKIKGVFADKEEAKDTQPQQSRQATRLDSNAKRNFMEELQAKRNKEIGFESDENEDEFFQTYQRKPKATMVQQPTSNKLADAQNPMAASTRISNPVVKQPRVEPPVKMEPVKPPPVPIRTMKTEPEPIKEIVKDPIISKAPVKEPVKPDLLQTVTEPPSRPNRPSHVSRALDLDLDDEDGDEVTGLDYLRGRGKDGQSSYLERIKEKRQRGTLLQAKVRPQMEASFVSDRTNSDEKLTSSFSKQEQSLGPPRTSSIQEIVVEDFHDAGFVDFNAKRTEVAKMAIERRQQARKTLAHVQRAQQPVEMELSSDSDLTDKKFEDNVSIDSDEIELGIQRQDAELKLEYCREDVTIVPIPQEPTVVAQLFEATYVEPEDDLLNVVAQNENMFRAHSEKRLKDQRHLSLAAKSLDNGQSSQSVLTEPQSLKFVKVEASCIAISGDFLICGGQSGQIYLYSIKQQKQLGAHKEDGKEFIDNPVTCIDVHSRRPDLLIAGFAKGQVIFINLQSFQKTIKVIKDQHHCAIVSVKFCDWIKEKPHVMLGDQHHCKDCSDVKSWMFLSCDQQGTVIQNIIEGIAFGMTYHTGHVLSTDYEYSVMASKMQLVGRPVELDIDQLTLIALGNSEHVVVWNTFSAYKQELITFDKPKRYPSENMDDVVPVMDMLPKIAWGYGKTPRYNFQSFALLAIAWGPIIQILVLREGPVLELDGYYIIAPQKQSGMDVTIVSLSFIDDSLLIAVTSSQEVRVMNTLKFKENAFEAPQYLEIVDMQVIDSRCKMLAAGSQLTDMQAEIEMERCTKLASQLGPHSSTYVSRDTFCCLTTQGVITMHHLDWLESLGDTESSVVSGSWIEIFAKALQIYTGKVKGLRMHGLDDKRDTMRDMLKQMIDKQVGIIIAQWKGRTDQALKTGQMNQIQVIEDLNSKFQTLIRIVVEFCVEIQEPVFLFDTLLKKFHSEGKSMLFAEELKPYILSGHFADCNIDEQILSKQILKHHQKTYEDCFEQIKNGQSGESISAAISPAENFEKILLNFRFDSCGKDYKQKLIDFCRSYGLTSGLMYMCIQCYGEQGPLQALTQLKDLYLDTCSNEIMVGRQLLQREDLIQLNNMPANYYDRIQIERSSCYLGLKLLWSAKLYLQGKKFPRGFFSQQEWHVLCHDVIELITQDDMISLLTEIDAQIYFGILVSVFVNTSTQFYYLEQGRPTHIDQNMHDTISMSHSLIVTRVSTFFDAQTTTDPAHFHHLCFLATIAGTFKHPDNPRLYCNVALELLDQSDKLVEYCKQLIASRRNGQFKRTAHFSDCLQLAEAMLLMLFEQSKPYLQPRSSELIKLLKTCEKTSFQNVKLVLNELNDDYLKCLQLFIENQQKNLEAITWQGKQDGFAWIQDKFSKLQQLSRESRGEVQKQQLINFQKEVLNQALFLVQQNLSKTILLCDTVFNQAHHDFLDQMKHHKELQLKYIQVLLDLKRQEIKEALLQSMAFMGRSKSAEQQKWQSILALHVRLLCEFEPTKVTQQIELVIREGFYPMEQCLEICQEFKQIEAAALLNKKIGNYDQALQLYLQILKHEINYERLKKELYYLDKENQRHVEKERKQVFAENQARLKATQLQTSYDLSSLLKQQAVKKVMQVVQIKDRRQDLYRVWVEKFGKNIDLLDRSLQKIQNICKYHPKEVLGSDASWQMILTFLFTILFHPSLRKKAYCKKHLKLKMVEFCRTILPFVPFSRIIYGASTMTKTLRFKAVKELVNDVFADKSQEFEMCLNAEVTQERDLIQMLADVQTSSSQGFTFVAESLFCGICEQCVVSKIGIQETKMFDCHVGFNHAYHQRCLKTFFEAENSKLDKADTPKAIRCPKCYPKPQEIIFATEQKKHVKENEDSDSESSKASEARSEESPMMRRQVSQGEKTEQMREKQMKRFEEMFMNDALTKADFVL